MSKKTNVHSLKLRRMFKIIENINKTFDEIEKDDRICKIKHGFSPLEYYEKHLDPYRDKEGEKGND